jgi:hypothetical protein
MRKYKKVGVVHLEFFIAWQDPKLWKFFRPGSSAFTLVKHKSVDYVGFDPIAECPCFFFKACATTCFLDDDEYLT